MKEYKLSAKSKYSVFYLLCGLFMFFFMFAILNLSSYASSFNTSNVSLAVNESYSETYGILSYNYNLDDYSVPVTTITTHSSGTGWSRSSTSNTCRGSNTIHLVTSEGDFVVNVSQGNADGSNTNHTVNVLGVPERVYSEFEVFNNTSVAKTVNAFSYVDSISVSDLSGKGVNSSLHDFYTSYNFATITNSFTVPSNFGGFDVQAGSNYNLSFPDFNEQHFITKSKFYAQSMRTSGKLILLFTYTGRPLSYCDIDVRDDVNRVGTHYHYYLSDLYLMDQVGSTNTYALYLDLPYNPNQSLFIITFDECYAQSGNISNPNIRLMQYVGTVSDYMEYVKQNYDNISPSVIDMNNNTAQSVSDISTAQTFETSAFDNFDAQFTSSGLDTFSMSFASTPLLWVSSIITTFYNNMPATFQYLLMFVAFVGILCTVLNVFGRVAQRFGGGDNATKLNSKDVFSKIEKNGSI